MGRADHLGMVREGQLADLVVMDVSGLHHLGTHHPIPDIALRGQAGDVRVVVVNGEVVVDAGGVTTIDTEEAVREATDALAGRPE